MTQSTDTRNRRAVLRFYRRARRVRTPYDAMVAVRDLYAFRVVYDVQIRAFNVAVEDAFRHDVADSYKIMIEGREDDLPYWLTGKITAPIPPEVIDRCLSCGTRWENHNDALTLHAFRSSL